MALFSQDPMDLTGYELVDSIESSGGFGSFGVKIFVLQPERVRKAIEALPNPRPSATITPREKARSLLRGAADVDDEEIVALTTFGAALAYLEKRIAEKK